MQCTGDEEGIGVRTRHRGLTERGLVWMPEERTKERKKERKEYGL